MNEFSNDMVNVLIRVTILLAVGWSASILLLRFDRPKITLILQRVMLAGVWLAIPLILWCPPVRLPVLPSPIVAHISHDDTAPSRKNLSGPTNITPAPAVSLPAKFPSRPRRVLEQTPSPNGPDGSIGTDLNHDRSRASSSQPSSSTPSTAMDNLEPATADSGVSIADEKILNQEAQIALPTKPTSGSPRRFRWRNRTSIPLALLVIWGTVASVLLSRVLAKAARTWKCIAASVPADPSTERLLRSMVSEMSVAIPQIRFCDSVRGPCTTGWRRSVILLPETWFCGLDRDQRQMVLAHEIAHVAGRDAMWDAASQFTRALWWFHPLVIPLVRAHRLACEHRCDDVAACFCGNPDLYRRQLARWVLEFQNQDRASLAVAMADKSLMLKRLRWLKKRPRDVAPVSRSRFALATIAGIFACALALSLQPESIAQTDAQSPATDDSLTKDQTSPNEGDETEPTQEKPKPALFTPITWGEDPINVDLQTAVDFRVRVVDEKDAPVANARVMLGTITDDTGVTASLPLIGGAVSNADGIALVKIPKGTERVGLTTEAFGFAKHRMDFNTSGTPEIKLKSGRVVTVRATDSNGNLLEDAFPILQRSRILGREFVKQDNGNHTSPVVTDDRRWMQVMSGEPEQPMLFSGLVDVTNDKLYDENGVMNLQLRPGVMLRGRLDDSVPRPVKNGFVELMIVQGEDHKIERHGLQWQDTAAINPDGTFLFESLPPAGHAQLFALGEGFQTRNPSEEEIRAYFEEYDAGDESIIQGGLRRPEILPQLIRLDQPLVETTLPCRKTASLDVRVVDPAGRPIADASGSMNPNGYFFSGELFIPGTEGSTRAMISGGGNGLALLLGAGVPRPGKLVINSWLRVRSDEEGVMQFRNIPSRNESYEVEANGYVMSAHPTSTPEDPRRFALVSLKDGELSKRTITMEREVARKMRELLVVYHDGAPLKDIRMTVTEISTSDQDQDWQQWSVQRFGAISQATSDQEGRLLLLHPMNIDGVQVKSLRLHVQGRPEKDVSFRAYVNVPVAVDGNVVRILPAKEPRSEGALRTATASYESLSGDVSGADLVKELLDEPSVVGLRRLLQYNDFDDVEPVALLPQQNSIRYDPGPAVVRVKTTEGERVVALAAVRPKSAAWTDRPKNSSPPQAALVFDAEGELRTVIGGGASASGSREGVMLCDLGSTGDHFVRVSAFESHPPFEYFSRWHRIGHETAPSMTVYHYANSNSWSGPSHGKPTPEYGFLGYEFNGQDIDNALPGVTPDGTSVPRSILWDRRRKSFVGPPTQSFENRALYRVVAEESDEFEALKTVNNSVVVAGGRRDFANWHLWTITVPNQGNYVAKLLIRDSAGSEQRLIRQTDLSAGQHKLQLQVDPDQPADGNSKLSVMIDAKNAKEMTKYSIPRMEVDARPSVEGQSVYAAGEAPMRLFDRKLSDGKSSLVWVIEKK